MVNHSSLKKRYVGLDVFRVISVLFVCAFHTYVHLGATYGILQGLTRMGAVFMTGFFMLSGYALFVNYAGTNVMELKNLKAFWVKRVIGIVPMYFVAGFLFILLEFLLPPCEDFLTRELVLVPTEVLCLQSVFTSLFDFSHNGGTWFISCIMICYFVYPFLQEIVRQISPRTKKILILLLGAFLLYSPVLVRKLELSSIYSNPIFRLFEFSIGVLLASLKPDFDRSAAVKKWVYNWFFVLAAGVLMTVGVTVLVKLEIAADDYMFYSLVCLPCFAAALVGASGCRSKRLERSRALKYFCSMSYVFFLAQLFSNQICKVIIAKLNITNNLLIIALGWVVCIAIALFFHEALEKPITGFLRKKAKNLLSAK